MTKRGQRSNSIFWCESFLAVAGAALGVLTTAWPDWIELLFRIDPDGHGGEVERLVAGGCLTAALALAVLARREGRLSSSWPAAATDARR